MGRSYSQVQHDAEHERDRMLAIATGTVDCPLCGYRFCPAAAVAQPLPDRTPEQRATRALDLEPAARRLAAWLDLAVGDLFGLWLAPLRLVDAASDRLYLAAPSETSAWVADRFGTLLADGAESLSGRAMTVVVAPWPSAARTLGELHHQQGTST